jgi:hypothetical protein
MTINPSESATLKKSVAPVVTDIPHAPFLYFEEAPAFGCNNGIVNITIAAYRVLPTETGTTNSDLVVVGSLRCNIQAAISLKNALDGALLLAAKTEGEAN